MRRYIIFFTLAIFLLAADIANLSPAADQEEGCTVLIAGRKTTVDGSILFAKTEDDGLREVDYLWYVPRMKHESGSAVNLHAGGKIPQIPETYAFFWDECPGTAFSNGIVNEWGVVFGSNACVSREDSVKEVQARGDLKDGGIGFMLRIILAQRSRTAHEAVELAAKIIDEYGYSGSGRNLNIVDPNEAWQLQMVRGKIYVARKVQDDEAAIIANTFSIREVDPGDKKNFICSPNLIEYAVKRGWYDPEKDGKFDFAKAYAPPEIHTRPSNTHRQWIMAKLLNKNFPITLEEADAGMMPVAVKPDRKLSVADVISIMRNHYEGTALDSSENYKTSPHVTAATICNYGSHRTTVIQQRSWLPLEIGTVTWRALDQPCSSVFVPWYLGATSIPEPFRKAPESLYTTKRELLDFHFNMPEEAFHLDMESASSVFTLLGEMVDKNYYASIERVHLEWSDFEQLEFALQPAIEETALKLYRKDKKLCTEFLNLYTSSQALKALETARNLIDEIKMKLWGTRGKEKIKIETETD